MSDTTYAIGDKTWSVMGELEAEQREAWLMYRADLAAHREWLKSQRPDRDAEHARANAYYDAVAEHTRALGMHMM